MFDRPVAYVIQVWQPIIGPTYAREFGRVYRYALVGLVVGTVCMTGLVLVALTFGPRPITYVLIGFLGLGSTLSFTFGLFARGRLASRLTQELRQSGHVVDHAPGLQSPQLAEKWLRRNNLTAMEIEAAATGASA